MCDMQYFRQVAQWPVTDAKFCPVRWACDLWLTNWSKLYSNHIFWIFGTYTIGPFLHNRTTGLDTGVGTSFACQFRVQDSRDLILNVIIYFDGKWWRLNPVRYCVRRCRFKLGDMENGVYCAELVWKSESEWESYLHYNFEWTEVLLR